MTASFDIDVLGLRVRVRLPEDLDEGQGAVVRAAWSGATIDDHGVADAEVSLRAMEFDAAMERLSVDVTLAALDRLRDRMLMFHAAGIVDDAGRVAAFVGPSGRGKTTLSRTLSRLHGYVSDETVAVDADLRVHAYRKPLSVVREGRPKEQVSPAAAGLGELPDAPLRLAALVLLERDPQLDAPSIAAVPLSEAIPELVSQMSYLRDQEQPLQTLARLCDGVGGVIRLSHPDAATVPAVLDSIFDHAPVSALWQPLSVGTDTGPYTTAHAADAIIVDGRVVVMAGPQVQVLDGIAPTIWKAAAAGFDLDGIVAEVLDVYGAPPQGEARAFVEAALEELVTADIVRRR